MSQLPYVYNHLLIIRGLCSFGVLFSHVFNYMFSNSFGCIPAFKEVLDAGNIPGQDYFTYIFPRTGKNFVEIFFILSGYLMGKVFSNSSYALNINSLRRFYKNRLLRIVPLLYFSLFILICVGGKCGSLVENPVSVLGDVFFLNNITGTSINDVTWSLSYEMQYYLVCPIVFLFLSGKSSQTARLVAIITAGLFAVSIIARATGHPLVVMLSFSWLFLGGYSIVIFVHVIHEKSGIVRTRTLACAAYASFVVANILFYAIYNSGWMPGSGYIFNIASIPLFIFTWIALVILELPKATSLTSNSGTSFDKSSHYIGKGLTWGGKISYGVYLWHLPILLSLLNNEAAQQISGRVLFSLSFIGNKQVEMFILIVLWQVICLVLTTALSTITFHLVEARYRPNMYSS